uniref:Uncharacterized protein n=1 Tax=Globodera rostochiensis TaxID=31243 RepID=A0A914H655_GLORO
MSFGGLFPFTAAAAAENNNNNKSAAAAASFLGALSDNSGGSYHHQNILLTPAVGAEGATAVAVAAALVEGHQQQQQRSPFRKAISPVQQPYISGTGGAKRKLPSFQSERGMQQFGKATTFAASDDDLDDDFKFEVEPRPKRRYEERMSTKLGDIRLKEDECGGAATAPAAMSAQQQQQLHRRTPQFLVESQKQQQHKQREGPLIEDVTDWGVSGDEDLFENGGFMFRRPSSSATPIVEEPDECAGAVDGLMAGRVRHDDEEEEEADELNLDSGCCSSSSSAEEEERQSIELSPELRNLITSMNNNRDGAAAVPTSILRPIRTGKELIPFMPSPVAAVVAAASASIPSCSLTENGRRFQHEDDEQQQLLLRVEEVLDDEILPDAAVGTPQVLSDNEEYWPPTPPPFDGMMTEEDGPDVVKKAVLVNEEEAEEEAMEMD